MPRATLLKHAAQGAFHGSEVPFVFGDLFELSSSGERAASAAMGCWWRNFAASADPNNGACVRALSLPRWSPVTAAGNSPSEDSTAALFITNTSLKMRPGYKASACEVFARF